MSRREIENEDEDDDILGSWPFMVILLQKAYLDRSLVYSDYVETVDRRQLDEKNEIAKMVAMKKIDTVVGKREFEIQSRLAIIRS